jgi:tripartite-type tricarboxylate transporter receptor subunit TctC
MKLSRCAFYLGLIIATTVGSGSPTPLQAQGAANSSYFTGKTVTILVGFAPGGAAGTGAGVVGRWLKKYIPGHPNVVVEYKPGAGGRILFNSLYNVSTPNGLEIAYANGGTVIGGLLGDPAVKYESDKFGWLGILTNDAWVLTVRSATGVTSLAALRKADKKLKIGAISTVHKTFSNARLLEDLLGVEFDMVTGYPGGNDINLALSRGEIDGTVASYSGFMQRNFSLYQSGELAVLVQSGRPNQDALAGLTNVPVIWKLTSAEKLPLLRIATIPLADAYIVAPHTAPVILNTLRIAFEEMSKDLAFVTEYKKGAGVDVEFTTGQLTQEYVETIMKSPRSAIEGMKKLLENK